MFDFPSGGQQHSSHNSSESDLWDQVLRSIGTCSASDMMQELCTAVNPLAMEVGGEEEQQQQNRSLDG